MPALEEDRVAFLESETHVESLLDPVANGAGLQFNDADGTYNFNGTTTLNGGNAGIDILGVWGSRTSP